MDENLMRVTDKELFYSAMMLNLNRLVGVEYAFPADEERLARELNEAKRSLHRKRLLKENSKGEVTLDFALSVCAAFCANPESCVTVDEGGYHAVVYSAVNAHLLLERGHDHENAALWFGDRESLDGYVTRKLASLEEEGEEAGADGGA